MIDKVISSKTGIRLDSNGDAVYSSTPLVSGYTFINIRLPECVKRLVTNYQELEYILAENVHAVDLPASTIIYEPREHGRGLRTMVPMGEDTGHEFTMRFYENVEFDVFNILSIWYSCILNPATYRPLLAKKLGESWMDLINTTVTIYILPQNFLNNPDSVLIYKAYGTSISSLNNADFQPDITQNNLVTLNVTFQADRLIPLTKTTAVLYGLERVYIKSLRDLKSGLDRLTDYAYRSMVEALTDLEKSIQQT
jgi:hypothetical protein